MGTVATGAIKEPTTSLAALKRALADHISRQRPGLVQAWVTQLRQILALPAASGLPNPATQALAYKELDRLMQQLVVAIGTGNYADAVAATAANHHEPLEHVDSLAPLLIKLDLLGNTLRRSIIDDPTLVTTPTLYLLERVLSKLTTEATLEFAKRRHASVDRVNNRRDELKETLEAILNGSPIGIMVTDRAGLITYFNREQERISGVTRDQALSKKLYQDYARRAAQDVLTAFRKAIEHGTTTALPRHRYPGRKGEQVLSISIGPIRDQQGAIMGTVHVCRDVTEMAQLEGQLMQRNRELAAKVGELEEAYTYIGKVNRQFASLIDVNSTLGTQLSLDKVLDFIVRSAAMLTRGRLVTLRRLDGQHLVLQAQYGLSAAQAAKYRDVDVEHSDIGRVIREKRQILVVDLENDPAFQWPELIQIFGLRRLVSVPLHSRGRTIGTLSIHLSEQRQFTNLELNFLIALANQAALAIDLERTLRNVRPNAARPATPVRLPVPERISTS